MSPSSYDVVIFTVILKILPIGFSPITDIWPISSASRPSQRKHSFQQCNNQLTILLMPAQVLPPWKRMSPVVLSHILSDPKAHVRGVTHVVSYPLRFVSRSKSLPTPQSQIKSTFLFIIVLFKKEDLHRSSFDEVCLGTHSSLFKLHGRTTLCFYSGIKQESRSDAGPTVLHGNRSTRHARV